MSDRDTGEALDTSEEAQEGQGNAPRGQLPPEEYEKRIQAQARDLRAQRAEIRNLRQMIESKGAEPQTKQERAAEPDLETDPIAWMKYARERLNAFDAAEREEQERQRQANAQQAQVQQISRQMEEFESDFRLDHPDYNDAAAHYRKVRAEELEEEGVSKAEVGSHLVQELVGVVARAIRAGKDPAQVVYALAKKRGFGVDASEKKLQTIERAQSQGKSLSQGGGRSGDGELTYEYVSSLKGQEFRDAMKRLKAQEKRRA